MMSNEPIALHEPRVADPESIAAVQTPPPSSPRLLPYIRRVSGDLQVDATGELCPPDRTFKVWLNFPRRLERELLSGDTERVEQALQQIVITHNGWLSEQGSVFPSPADPEFWLSIDNAVLLRMVRLIQAEQLKEPASS